MGDLSKGMHVLRHRFRDFWFNEKAGKDTSIYDQSHNG